eukprot:2673046-Rhodomonas_salina.2
MSAGTLSTELSHRASGTDQYCVSGTGPLVLISTEPVVLISTEPVVLISTEQVVLREIAVLPGEREADACHRERHPVQIRSYESSNLRTEMGLVDTSILENCDEGSSYGSTETGLCCYQDAGSVKHGGIVVKQEEVFDHLSCYAPLFLPSILRRDGRIHYYSGICSSAMCGTDVAYAATRST